MDKRFFDRFRLFCDYFDFFLYCTGYWEASLKKVNEKILLLLQRHFFGFVRGCEMRNCSATIFDTSQFVHHYIDTRWLFFHWSCTRLGLTPYEEFSLIQIFACNYLCDRKIRWNELNTFASWSYLLSSNLFGGFRNHSWNHFNN